MCGRAAYSSASLSSAASTLGCDSSPPPPAAAAASNKNEDLDMPNNPNISPGNSVHIFRYNHDSKSVYTTPMIWGLLPDHGTTQSPRLLPSDDNFTPSPHYIMFNARSETIDTKKSFHNLLRGGKSCIFAVDGYYEWTKSLSPIEKRKQPYFVKSSSSDTPLFLAGLCTQVKTGRRHNNNQEETISTFTILTTEAHPKYAWLHPRQPCILLDGAVAREWLQSPSKVLVDKIRSNTKNRNTDLWECYPVTKKMNDDSYQGEDCTVEVKSKGRKLESYFVPSSGKRQKVDAKGHSPKSNLQQELEGGEKKNVVSKCSQKYGSNDALSPTEETLSNEWSCHVCTFLHTKSKSQFLACDMCGSERDTPKTVLEEEFCTRFVNTNAP